MSNVVDWHVSRCCRSTTSYLKSMLSIDNIDRVINWTFFILSSEYRQFANSSCPSQTQPNNVVECQRTLREDIYQLTILTKLSIDKFVNVVNQPQAIWGACCRLTTLTTLSIDNVVKKTYVPDSMYFFITGSRSSFTHSSFNIIGWVR